MSVPWQHLLSNFAVVALVVSLWTHSKDWTETWTPLLQRIAFGLLMGIGALGVMFFPFELRHGVFVDLRSAFTAISGLFGGPLAAAISAVIAIVYRAEVGGPGALAGCIGLVKSSAIGVLAHFLLVGKIPNPRFILLFSAGVAASSVVGFLAIPQAIWTDVFAHVVLPLALLLFVSTAISAMAIVQEQRRRDTSRTNHLYRTVIEALPDCLNIKDLEGRFLIANPATAALMRAPTSEDLIGKTDFDFYPRATAEMFRREEQAIIARGTAEAIEQKLVQPDGTVIWLSTMKAPLHTETGQLAGLISHNRDITDRKLLEIELLESRNRLSDALTNMADALVMFDRAGRLVFCNQQYLVFFHRTADVRVPGANIRDILRVVLERGEETTIDKTTVDAWIDTTCATLLTPGDREIHLNDGRWLQARISPSLDGSTMIVMSDITRSKSAENQLLDINRKLELLSTTDGLTGLVNRRGFDQAIDAEFTRSVRSGTSLSLLFIDLDKFKVYNDAYGHLAGDEVLKTVSRCLRGTLKRPSDIAARYGGEELVAILPNTSDEGALQLAEAFRLAVLALGIPHKASDKGVVTVSIGVAARRQGIGDVRDLLARADTALYSAKKAGRNRVHDARPRLQASAWP